MNTKKIYGIVFHNGIALRPSTTEFIKSYGIEVLDYIGLEHPKMIVNSSGMLCYNFPVNYRTLSELCTIMDNNFPKKSPRLIKDLVFFQYDFQRYEPLYVFWVLINDAILHLKY